MLNFWPFNIRAKRLERMRAEQRRYEEENRRKREETQDRIINRQRKVIKHHREQRALRDQQQLHKDCAGHDARYSQNPAQAMGSILVSEPVMSDSSRSCGASSSYGGGSSDFGSSSSSSSSSSSCGSDF